MRLASLCLLTLATLCGCAGNDARIVLVTGATGTQGGAVARELLERGYRVRGLTRNTQSDRASAMAILGAEMVQGDFDDAASLAAAMNGVYGVFVVTNYWEHGYDKEVLHGKQVINAALAADVRHLVFSSVGGADTNSGVPHFDSKYEVELYLQNSGIGFSIVRPVEFMDNIRYSSQSILAGTYLDPRDAERSHQWIAASDIGFFVAEAFDNPDDWLGRTLEIAGDELTIGEFAEVLSRSVGVDVTHEQVSWEDYEARAGAESTEMVRWFDEHGYTADVTGLRSEYPKLLTYEQYLQGVSWE